MQSHIHQLEQRLAHAQVQAERAISLEYACSQLQQRNQDLDSRIVELQGERSQRLCSTGQRY